MTSAIVSATIDATYPVAGQDNDSQGFRDNFSIIKQGLATAASEITNLQNNAARTDTANDFLGNVILNAELTAVSSTFFPGGNLAASLELNFNNGHYQRFTATNNVTLSFSNFPVGSYGLLRVELYGDGTNRTVSFAAPAGTIKKDGNVAWSGNSVTVSNAVNPIILEFWSYNGGAVIFGRYLGAFS